MITPLEIENKEFSKQLRGYNADEVDEFLDLIIEDIEAIQEELAVLRAENSELREQNEEYKRSQINVMNTLDTAKKLMKDISESAEKRAEIIIKNAKLDAEMIIRDAKDSASHYGNESTQLRDKILQFRARYKKLLRDEIDHIDEKGSDLLTDLEKEFFMPVPVDDGLERYKTRAGASEASISEIYHEDVDAGKLLEDLERDLPQTGETNKETPEETDKNKAKTFSEIPGLMETKIGVPKETVALNSKDIEDLLKKTEKKLQVNMEDLDKNR